jgi:ABC-type glutathione transport system ATPase component
MIKDMAGTDLDSRAVEALVQVRDLSVTYGQGSKTFDAVKQVSFEVGKGERVGLVGESGSGKTSVGRALVRLAPWSAGTLHFDGKPIHALGDKAFLPFRRRMQIIFQDPYASLNPRLTIAKSLSEALALGRPDARETWTDRMVELLGLVGLHPDTLQKYPHEFSGGQRQRIGIARALCVEPEFLICDEPVSALDVSIQAQVLNLLMDLQDRFHFSYLFISHDLRVVRHFCDRILVMQKGQFVETGPAEAIFTRPQHAYTRELLAAIPGRN